MAYIKQENSDFYADTKNHSQTAFGDGQAGDYNQPGGSAAQNSITAFLAKLWALVNDPSCDDLIAWDPSGGSFHVYDQARFAREILPRYFKHNNFASFIRQLNMYGFRKMSTIEHGSLKNEGDDIEFAHPNFLRGQESLLELIKRRAPETQNKLQGGANSALIPATFLDPKTGRPADLARVLDDVRHLQTRQTSLSDKLSYMQTENQALWNEIGSLRQKHNKQQQIVSKLMEFLLHFISTNSAPTDEHHVDRQASNEVLDAHSHQQQTGQTAKDNSNQQELSPNTLKRKYAALMHNDESNKRTTNQQQSQQYPHPPNLGRQQSVTINELSDHDAGGWPHTTNTSPLVDLVPSPPPTQNTDDLHATQQQNNYRWSSAANDLHRPMGHDQRNLAQQAPVFQAVNNGNNQPTNPYVPDFVLRTDNPNGTTAVPPSAGLNLSQPNSSKQVPAGSSLKAEQPDYPNQSLDNLNPSQAAYSEAQHQHKIGGQPNDQGSFSLSDITGDVDHIQTSLDSIRDLMFEHLPEGASIDDLFGDSDFLSPLLQSENPLMESLHDQKLTPGDQQVDSTTTTSQSVPHVNNQLLHKLISEAAVVEEQRQTIDQLEREKSDLESKVHLLEQQQQQQQQTSHRK